jgi:hypothetical protein
MSTCGVWRRVALVRTDVSEKLSTSIIRVTRIGELGTTLAVTNNRRKLRRNLFLPIIYYLFLRRVRRLLNTARVVPSTPFLVTMMKEALSSFEASILTAIPEDSILHSHRRENLNSYKVRQCTHSLSAPLCIMSGCISIAFCSGVCEVLGSNPGSDTDYCH